MRRQWIIVFLLIAVIIFWFFNNSDDKDYDFMEEKKKESGEINILDRCQKISSPGNYTLERDILGGSSCFSIESDNVKIDGLGHSITGNRENKNYGISLIGGKNIEVKNIKIIKYEKGINIVNAENVLIENNSLEKNLYGIWINGESNKIIIKKNKIRQNGAYAIETYGKSEIVIEDNIIEQNFRTFNGEIENANIKNNLLQRNVHSFSSIQRPIKEASLNETIKLNMTLRNEKNELCPSCAIKIETFPNENIKIENGENSLEVSFSPSREGIYSFVRKITDDLNNTEINKYLYLINAKGEEKREYFARGKDPSHGQALSWGGLQADSGSLLFEKNLKDELRVCSDWIQISPDNLPPYLLGIVKRIEIELNYNHSSSVSKVGVQRFASYDDKTDYEKEIASSGGVFRNEKFSFDVDWPMNYFWEWYWMAVKLSAPGGFPQILVQKDNSSYAYIYYRYSDTPAIRKISNEDITFLSATMDRNKANEAEIVLEGYGNTELEIEMPEKNIKYGAKYDGVECDENSDCLLSRETMGEMDFNLNLNGMHKLIIFPKIE